jgi:hypothetical protein
MLIEILILFFIFLLIYQSYLFIIDNNSSLKKNNIIEGYTDYEETSYMLSQKNAVNIQDLKERIDKISNINNNYDELNNRLKIVENKINNIANSSFANTKGKDVNINQSSDLNNSEDSTNGLPTTIDTSTMTPQSQGNIPPMNNLDNNNNNLY